MNCLNQQSFNAFAVFIRLLRSFFFVYSQTIIHSYILTSIYINNYFYFYYSANINTSNSLTRQLKRVLEIFVLLIILHIHLYGNKYLKKLQTVAMSNKLNDVGG